MVTTITKNYELDIIQARIIKVGEPNIFELVDPESLTVITKRF